MFNLHMSSADTRRAVLRTLIKTRYSGVSRQFALAVKKPEGQINDMLSDPPRKSFGEKVARQLEDRAGLTPGYFDQPANADESGKVAPFVSETIGTYDVSSPIADVVKIMQGLPIDDQREILGAARYIEKQARQRLENSSLRAG